MAETAASTGEISLEQLAVLLHPEAIKICEALSDGKKPFDELTKQVGDQSLTAHYLNKLETMKLVVRGPYEIIQPPYNGKPGKARQTFDLNPYVLQTAVTKLEELSSFYNQLIEETRAQNLT